MRVEVVNRSGRRTPVLLFEDQLPPGLEASTRVVLPPLRPMESARLSYRLRAARARPLPRRARPGCSASSRSGWSSGPGRRPCATSCSSARGSTPLTAVLPVRRTGRGGDSDLGGAGVVGDPDLSVREHRHGDDLRRVHWPTTARRGQLMVRPDQHPQDHNAVVLLDSRADGQRGARRAARTLELLVSAAASVVVHAADLGQRVALLGDGEDPLPGSHDTAHRDDAADDPVEEALDRLAVVRPTGPDSLAAAVEAVPRWNPSMLVALLGEVGPEDVEVLAGTARDAVAGGDRLPDHRRGSS